MQLINFAAGPFRTDRAVFLIDGTVFYVSLFAGASPIATINGSTEPRFVVKQEKSGAQEKVLNEGIIIFYIKLS